MIRAELKYIQLILVAVLSIGVIACSDNSGSATLDPEKGVSSSIDEDKNILDPQIIRTNFDDDEAWNKLCRIVNSPSAHTGLTFHANVEFINDVRYENNSLIDILKKLSKHYYQEFYFVFVADDETFQTKDLPIQCIIFADEDHDKEWTFRVIPSEIWSVEANLRTGNIECEDYMMASEIDGVFRGF